MRSDSVARADVELIRKAAGVLGGAGGPVNGLAEALAINNRSVQRWVAGQNAVPAAIWQMLHDLAAKREGEAGELRALLAQKMDQEF